MFIIGVFECDVVQLFGLYPGGLLCVDVVVEPGLVLGVPLGDPVPHYQLVVGWWGGGGAGGACTLAWGGRSAASCWRRGRRCPPCLNWGWK